MATNAGPCYGKQYIRYAETFEAPSADHSGTPGTVEIGEFRLVCLNDQQPGYAWTHSQSNGLATAWAGVNQAYMPTTTASPATARQLTVARSGLLLVEVDPASNNINIGSQLNDNGDGQAIDSGHPVIIDGTTPIVRENINIGGRRMVLVSFA